MRKTFEDSIKAGEEMFRVGIESADHLLASAPKLDRPEAERDAIAAHARDLRASSEEGLKITGELWRSLIELTEKTETLRTLVTPPLQKK